MLRVSLSQRNKSKGVLTWYARVFDTDTKEIRYVSLGTDKKTVAKDLMGAKLARGEFEKVPAITLGYAMDLFMKDNERRGLSNSTLVQYRQLSNVLFPLYGRNLVQLGLDDVIKSFEVLGSCKASTWNKYKDRFKRFLAYCEDFLGLGGKLYHLKKITPKKAVKRPKIKFWTLDQIDQILDHAPTERLRLGWAFMAFAGLRLGEVVNLKDGNIKDGWIELVGKGDKFARVPVSSRMAEEVARFGRSLDFSDLRKQFYMVLKRVVAETIGGNAHPHMFRHSFASNLIRKGTNIKAVQRLMRHDNIGLTLDTYSHLLDDDLKNSVDY